MLFLMESTQEMQTFCSNSFYFINDFQCAVEVRRHTPWSCVRCRGCWPTHSQFHSQFLLRRHSLCITLKYTTLVRMRSSYAWTMKPWQRNEWRLGFNSVYWPCHLQFIILDCYKRKCIYRSIHLIHAINSGDPAGGGGGGGTSGVPLPLKFDWPCFLLNYFSVSYSVSNCFKIRLR